MLKQQRQKYISDRVNRERVVSVDDLSRSLDVSYMTIWRDLAELEKLGLLQRVRGGAVSKENEDEPTQDILDPYRAQHDEFYENKELIARYAANHLIRDGENITIEAGTTASAIVRYLNQDDLTVITNGLAASLLAAQHLPDITVMCSGGVLIDTGAFIGPQAESFFLQFRVNKAFFGAQGLTLEDGFTDPTPLYSQLKRAMKENAGQTIMMVDSSKLGVRSLVQVMRIKDVDIIVTDQGAPHEIVEGLISKGVDVRIAGKESY